MILAFAGPPCSGKSELCSRISVELGIPHISSGGLIRAAAEAGDPEAIRIWSLVKGGPLSPPEYIIGLVWDRISQSDCRNGYILDGFPRLPEEADAYLTTFGRVDGYVRLHLDDETLAERARARGREDDEAHALRMEIHHNEWEGVNSVFESHGCSIHDLDAGLSMDDLRRDLILRLGVAKHVPCLQP